MKKALFGFTLGFVLLGSAALASIPDSGGVIHGCYLTAGNPNVRGALRVIDTGAGETCTGSEVALTWSQTGPQGPAGPAGTTGATGPQGPAGFAELDSTAVTGDWVAVENNNTPYTASAFCLTGYISTGGGFELFDQDGGLDTRVLVSGPVLDSGTPVGWSATALKGTGASEYVRATVVCLKLA